MLHSNTQRMIDYWSSRTEPGRAPQRSAIDPADFRPLMSQVFVVGRAGRGRYEMRLAGGLVADLHGRDLRAADALSLWSERDRLRLQAALEEARQAPGPLVVMAEALTDGPSLSLEVLFAPLAGAMDRYLGLYQPLAMLARLQRRPVLELSVRALRRPGAANAPAVPVRLAALNGRRIA
jgi:hypothetical protein